MAVHYKFKSAKEFDSIAIEGHFISVSQLKERIVEKMKLGRAPDFDLVVSNFQTNEEYADEGSLVPRNTSVLVRRVPGAIRMQRFAQPEIKPEQKVEEVNLANKNTLKPNANNDWGDEFGVDLYEQPDNSKTQGLQSNTMQSSMPSNDRIDEEAKIRAFVDSSASDWQRQTQEAYAAGRGFGRGRGGPGRGGPIGFSRKAPPEGYVCHRCHHPGHYIQHCPTNGDPAYNVKKVKLPTGIPRTMLVPNPDGPYAMPNGEGAVLKPNEDVFEKEVNALTGSKMVTEVPLELKCPLCRDVLKDAVLTSKCCFKSYCDRCIRNEIIKRGRCACGATNVLADDLLPNTTLRDAIDRLLDANAPTGSADNAGSKQNIPDMESALPKKAPSPSASASLKQSTLVAAAPDGPNEVPNAVVAAPAPSADLLGASEVESATKDAEPGTQSGKGDDEAQQQQQGGPGKKNKPKRPRPPKQGQQMPWRGMPPDGMEDGPMMGYTGNQAPFPGFWPAPAMGDGYMAMGENYMMGYGPYNGYGAPFDMHYGAGAPMMPDPYAYPGMMPPVPPYPQRDYGGPGFDSDYGSRSRDDYDAKKSESRRKHSSSDHGRDRDREQRERERERERERDHNRDYDERESSVKVNPDSRSRKRSRDEYSSHREEYSHRDDYRDRDEYAHHHRERDSSRDRRESSKDRRTRHEESGHRRTHVDGGHSSGDDVSSEQQRQSSRHSRHKSSDEYYKSSSSKAAPAVVAASYRSPHDESTSSKRRKEEVAGGEESEEGGKHSRSGKRVSVFLRVKQQNGVGHGEDEELVTADTGRRRSSRSSAEQQQQQQQQQSHHVEPENENSVFSRISTNSSSSSKHREQQRHHHHSSSRKQSA